MKTPTHWQNKNLLSYALLPLGFIYSQATALRLKIKKSKSVNIPVICVGNLTAGGTGKTPTAIAIADIIQKLGQKPFFVSRGYGGSLSGVIVDNQKHTPKQVGDEPLLLSQKAGVSVNADRYAAAQKAIANGGEVIIMDDGFQNPSLKKDLSFLVFDGGSGIGNAFPLPAGPLRENFAEGIKRADAAIIIGEDKTNLRAKIKNLPVFNAKICSQSPQLKNKSVIAFAGIGRPQKFYDSLRQEKVKILQTIDFPDHHFYSEDELQNLLKIAKEKDAELITTSKDWVKIPPRLQPHFKVLEIYIEWENSQALTDFIQKKLKI